jgi:electron transport complex protein RnfA
MTTLAALAVFSGLSLNLLLQFGLGIGGIIEPEKHAAACGEGTRPASFRWLILFVSTFVLWLFFTYALTPPAFGFLESFLLFPAAMLVSAALEVAFAHFGAAKRLPRKERGRFNPWKLAESGGAGISCAADGLAPASLFLTLRLAASPVDALVLSLGFSLGCLAAALILREINRRSSLEAVPGTFRGAPLTLISMGLLSLIFSSVSSLFLRVLGVF